MSFISTSSMYHILRLTISLGLLIPAYLDWRSRWIDDRSWFAMVPSYIILIYGIYFGIYPVASLLQGIIISVIIIAVMIVYRRYGYTFGGADFILLAMMSPLSIAYDAVFGEGYIVYPGFLLFLIITSILSIFYVLSICIWKNRNRFKVEKNFRSFIKLLYSYEVTEIDDDKEIVLAINGELKRVTPGVPLVSFGFIASLILFLIPFIF